MDLDFAADGNLRELSGKEAWEAIENFAQGQKEWDNPPNIISEQEVANLKAQTKRLFGNKNVWVKMHRGIAWDKVENPNPQVLPSFEEYTPPVTYPKEVENTLGTLIEVEPLNETKLEEVGLNCNHNTPLSSREVPSFDKPEPQPQPLPNYNLTIHTIPSSLVASFHLRDLYCYNRPCIDDPKKHYGFKPGLLGHSGSLGVDFSKLGMIEDDWKLESKEVSFLGRGPNSPVRPKEVEKVRIKETHQLEHKIQQTLFQHMAPARHHGVYRYYHPHLNSSVGEPSPLSVK
ncbi:hypothetical protein Tco_0302919 [Tanacetum coccineum]